MPDHPSAFALDLLALGDGPTEVRSHVDACAQCQVYVKQATTPADVPANLRVRVADDKARVERHARTNPRVAWWQWLSPELALAVLVMIGVGNAVFENSKEDALTTRPKGAGPALELFVKRGESVTLWDARSPVIAGDRLLLRVDSAGYTHTKVLAGEAVLFEGQLPADRSTPLPVSFKVDGEEGAEHLRIELSGGGLPAWATELELPKANP